MGLWIREIIGWILLVVGLNLFRVCFGYLNSRQVVEAAVGAAIGFFVFRAGMQLIRVAVAARAVLAERQLHEIR
jgi:hypothetical protein